MKILVACEESGVVRDSFAKLGHNAWSCDLVPSRRPGNHYQGDARFALQAQDWDLVIAHPPCTYLCNSGVRWLHSDPDRWRLMREACEFFLTFLNFKCPRIAIENPVMHKHARQIIQQDWTQTLQPWQYGHGECKRTCLWLRGLPLLTPTNIVSGREQRVHRMAPGPERARLRSETYEGVANAMATQWSSVLI